MRGLRERSVARPVDVSVVAPPRRRSWLGWVIGVFLGLGAALRFGATSASFPGGDGGLFFAVVQKIESGNHVWPHEVLYSGNHLTFAYPPFGFYLAAALHGLFGLSTLRIFEYLPFAVTVLAMIAMVPLARSVLRSDLAVAAAVGIFALSADTFYWEIKGGGITRSFGELFSILAIGQVIALYRSGQTRRVWPAGVFLSLVILSHPEWTMFTAVSVIAVFLFYARSRQGVRLSLATGAITLVIISAWLLPILLRDGIRPFVAVLGNNSDLLPWYLGIFKFLFLSLTDMQGFPVGPALGLVGLAVCLMRRDWFLPVWMLILYAAVTRGTSQEVVVIFALLTGVGVDWLWHHLAETATSPTWARRVALTAAVFLAVYVLLISLTFGALAIEHLSPSNRTAMSWIRVHTPPSARFAMITGSSWYSDAVEEWFPVVAHRTSLTTVQGYEWLPHRFTPQDKLNSAAQDCADRDVACLDRWAAHYHLHFSYVWVERGPAQESGSHKDCCWPLRHALDTDTHFVRLYATHDAVIYRRR